MLFGLLGAAMLPCGCPQPAHADGPGAGLWEYGDLEGPKKWGSMCSMGERQSPIDLPLPGMVPSLPLPTSLARIVASLVVTEGMSHYRWQQKDYGKEGAPDDGLLHERASPSGQHRSRQRAGD